MVQKTLTPIIGGVAAVILFQFDSPEAMDILSRPQYTSYDNQQETPSPNNINAGTQADSDETTLLLASVFEAAAKGEGEGEGEAHALLNYLQQGGSVDVRDSSNRTLLHVAVANGHLHIAEIVLRFGARIDEMFDNDQKTPLDYAVARGFDFLRRFLALVYGEFSLKGRWQSVRHHIQVNPESPATPVSKKNYNNRTVIRYRKAHHKTPQQFRKSDDYPLFRQQFIANTAHIKQLTKALFSRVPACGLTERLNDFERHVFENNGSYFSTRIGQIYGDIHQDICSIATRLEALPEQTQKNALELLLTDIDLCLDGVFTRTQQTLLYIDTQTATEARVTEAYRHLLEAVAIEHLHNNHHIPSQNEVHYINAYLNYLSESPVRQSNSAHWPDLQRLDVVSQSLGITEKDLEEFAEKAAVRVHAAEVVEWLTDRTIDELQGVLPQEWLSSPLQLSQLTSKRLEALNLWLHRLRVIVPDDLTLWELIEETEEGYDFSGMPLQLRRAIARNFSDRLYPLSQPDQLSRIQTCNNLVYWTSKEDGEDRAQPVTFADFQSLLDNRAVPVCERLVIEVIQSTRIFSQLLHLLIHALPEASPDVRKRLLNIWYTRTLSEKKTRIPFERVVISAPNELLQEIGLPDHYSSCFHDHWTGRELLKRLMNERVEWSGASVVKNRLLQDPDLLTPELIKETEKLSPKQKDQLLFRLVTLGKTDLLRSFPHLNQDTVNRPFNENTFLLCEAARMGRTETVRLLLDRGADIHNPHPTLGWNALFAAVQNGHTNTVALLLDRGAEINFIEPISGWSPLTIAAMQGNTDLIALLLDKKADIHLINPEQGWNALMTAICHDHTDTTALLLDRGADIHSINPKQGWNALTSAAHLGHTNAIRLLHDKGADINSINQNNGQSALTAAASNGLTNTVVLLLDSGADLHFTNQRSGMNALTSAVINDHTDTVALLLDRGVCIYSINPKYGSSSLTIAASLDHTNTLSLLLNRGADINFVNQKNGQSALTAAAKKGSTNTVTLLLDRGADINFVNQKNGHSALTTAAGEGHTDTVALLLDRGADIHFINQKSGCCALTTAASLGHTDTAALLLDRGADIHMDNPFNCDQALKTAAAAGHTTVVKLLLDSGADSNYISDNFNGPDNDGKNALMIAAQNGHKEIVTLLVDRGSDINLPNLLNGWTALTYAGSEGHSEVAKILIDAGTASSWRKWLLKLLF